MSLTRQVGLEAAHAIRVLWPEPLATELIGRFRNTLETGEGGCEFVVWLPLVPAD